jgi:hypothetical protein
MPLEDFIIYVYCCVVDIGILHKRPKVVDTFDLKKIDNKRP